ncbi:CDGSH iron-sulfur domain-containing protein [Bacteroidota bacterium]
MEDKRKKTTEFKVLKNGPLQVSGNFVLKSMGGKIIESKDPIFLCRCGGSKNKPYCDGSHRRIGLRD